MPKVLIALAAAALLSGQRLGAAPGSVPPPDAGIGRVAWFDITTTSLPQSKEFYGRLIHREFAPVAGSDQAAEIVAGGAAIGTLRIAEGKLSPFDGVLYVQLPDLPASVPKGKELGGAIAPGFPFNLPDGRGAIALVLDPSGHPVGMDSRAPLPAATKPAAR